MVDVPGGDRGVVVYGFIILLTGVGLMAGSYVGLGEYALLGLFFIFVGAVVFLYGQGALRSLAVKEVAVEYDYVPTRVKCEYCSTVQPVGEKCVTCGAPLPRTKSEQSYQEAVNEYREAAGERPTG